MTRPDAASLVIRVDRHVDILGELSSRYLGRNCGGRKKWEEGKYPESPGTLAPDVGGDY